MVWLAPSNGEFQMYMNPKKGDKMIARGENEQTGEIRGQGRSCTMESCLGRKVSVRWTDGKLTYVCTEGLSSEKPGIWRIR